MELVLTSNYYLEQEESINISNKLLKEYERQLDTSENTKRTYLACIKKFIEWLGDKEVSYITLVEYKNYLRTMYKAKATNTHITAIKDLFKFLEQKGFKNYAKNIKKERVSDEFSKDSLTLEQVKGIYNSVDINAIEGARANALFRLLIGTGLRECEVVRADVGDIRTVGNKTVLYVKGKGEREKNKYVVIYPTVMQALQHYFTFRQDIKDTSPLFISHSDRNNGERLTTRTIQRIVKGLYKNNGIVSERITTHSTRHTAITLSILNGANIHQAQAMARHKDVNTTMVYFHNIDRLNSNAEEKLENLFNNN